MFINKSYLVMTFFEKRVLCMRSGKRMLKNQTTPNDVVYNQN